jgi:hypothetical protein
MKRFDKNGMLIIPTPKEITKTQETNEILIVKECFCPNGHNLVSPNAYFNNLPGIFLKLINSSGRAGFVALSPIYGQKQRISLELQLKKGEKVRIFCPHCDIELPIYADCTSCKTGKLIALFLDKKASFKNCLAICNIIGCTSASIHSGEDVLKEIKYLLA